jgi:hypothetical protein
LKRAEGFLHVHRFDRMAHGFPNLVTQDETIELIEAWLGQVVAPAPPKLAVVNPATE